MGNRICRRKLTELPGFRSHRVVGKASGFTHMKQYAPVMHSQEDREFAKAGTDNIGDASVVMYPWHQKVWCKGATEVASNVLLAIAEIRVIRCNKLGEFRSR